MSVLYGRSAAYAGRGCAVRVKAIIIAFTVPLFMLLACVNGALLYVQDKAEMTRALDAQARAAAVTTAQFLSARPVANMLSADQAERLAGAAANIDGLKRMVLVRANAPEALLLGSSSPVDSEYIVSATAPVGSATDPRGTILAEIDSAPMYERLSALRYNIILLVIGAGLIGALLGWFLGSRISRELNHVLALIDGFFEGKAGKDRTKLTIRETIDLSNAVKLMGTSMRAAMARRGRQMAYAKDNRDESSSVLGYRKSCFPPVTTEPSGATIAVRMLGKAPAGCFYAIAQNEHEAAVIIGECDGDTPALALANAFAAQEYFERNILEGSADKIFESGRRAYSISDMKWVKWKQASPPQPQIMALLNDGDSQRASAYHALNPALQPDILIDDLAALLTPNGVVAVLGPVSRKG